MFFGYTRFLEEQNRLLQSRIDKLETRNQELVLKLCSISPISRVPDEKPHVDHHIETKGSRASCSCGWTQVSEDPGVLQNAVASHHRATAVSRGRTNWRQAKTALERASEETQ